MSQLDSKTTVGGFVLGAELGAGGMGRVVAAEHVATRQPAAVKLVSARQGESSTMRAAFVGEIQAAARLHHPNVVALYDHGTTEEDGTPWVAMELARGGTLRDRAVGDFASMRAVLLVILDALAHAHARGVVHRDLKPENVLLDEGRLVLADFGIAWSRTDPSRPPGERTTYDDDHSIAGTPLYMAPEQARGDLRAQGPWTDLYALGCMAWELASGAPPFVGPSTLSVLAGHLTRELPPLVARFPLPPGLEAWLGMLLAKEPRERFRRAADAATALAGFAAPASPALGAAASEGPLHHTPIAELATLAVLAPVAPAARSASMPPRGARSHAPPCPPAAAWLDARAVRSQMPAGLGLGLFGLRDVPFVGRDEERTRLASLVREVHRTRGPRVVILRGEAGVGKSHLARWLAERAHELGAATPLVLRHGPIEARGQGIAGALAAMLASSGLRGEALEARLAGSLDEPRESVLVQGLAEIIDPARGEAPPRLRFDASSERHAVVRQLLARACEERPLLLVVDDAQWGLDALGLVRHLTRSAPLPILVVLTVEEDALEGHEVAAALLDTIAASTDAVDLTLEPLGESSQTELVRQLVGLTPEAAASLAARTRSDGPIFAVQLLAELVGHDALVVQRDGLAISEGHAMPSGLDALWQARIEAAVSSATDRARGLLALVTVAAHGGALESSSLARVTAAMGSACEERDLGHLAAHGLLLRDGGSLRVVHPTLAHSIELLARAEGLWSLVHEAAARSLEDADDPRSRERRGRHLAEAGRPAEALREWMEVTAAYARAGDPDRAEAVEGLARALAGELAALDASSSLELARLGFAVQILRGRTAQAAAGLPPAIAAARAAGELPAEAGLTRLLAYALRTEGRVPEAMELMQSLRERWGSLTDAAAGELEFTMADLLFDQRSHAESLRSHRRALARFEKAGRLPATGHSWNSIANVLAALGDVEGEREARERAIEVHLRCGSRYGRACALADAATTEAQRGQLASARALFDRAETLFEEIGSANAEVVRRERDALG